MLTKQRGTLKILRDVVAYFLPSRPEVAIDLVSRLAFLLFLTSCATHKDVQHRVVISVKDQRLAVLDRETLVAVYPVSTSKYGTGRRMTQGVDQNRVALMMAMLEKRAGMQLLGDDVFVNIAGGLEVDEPAVDLGLVTAIASSFRNQPIDAHTAVFGEVGLTGEIRGSSQASVRAREAQALGFKRIVMPSSNTSGLEKLLGLRVIGVRSVDEALQQLF